MRKGRRDEGKGEEMRWEVGRSGDGAKEGMGMEGREEKKGKWCASSKLFCTVPNLSLIGTYYI